MLVANVPVQPAERPQGPPGGAKIQFGDILIPALWLAGALLVGALLWKIIAVVRDYQARKANTASSAQGQLSEYRKSFERGEMTEDEYDKVYKLLTGQPRKREVAAAQSSAPQAPPTDGGLGNGQLK